MSERDPRVVYCSTVGCDERKQLTMRWSCPAHARLMATAPDLLEAIKAAERFLTRTDEWRLELIAKLKAARADAEVRP